MWFSTTVTIRNIYKNTANSQIYINIPREDSYISLLNGYLELNFEVIKKNDNSRYANGNDIRLVDTGPIALFSNFKVTTSSAKQLEYIIHAHRESLRYKLLISSNDSDDLSFHFDRDRNRKQNQINKESHKRKIPC